MGGASLPLSQQSNSRRSPSCQVFNRRVVVFVAVDGPRFSTVDIQLCAEGNGDFVYPVDKRTHLFFDALLRRHVGRSVGRLVSSDCLQEFVKTEKKKVP